MNMKLIKNTENISKEKITLFCLPFAGGGASAYNQWAKKMQGKVTVCPVQDRKSTRLNSSHASKSRMPSSA